MEKNFYNLEYLPKMHRIGKVIGRNIYSLHRSD
jgi:hypothetical protein